MIMKIKKKYLFILIIFIILIFNIYNYFFNINNIDDGEYIFCVESPNNLYVLNAYVINGGSLNGDAIRVELVNKNNSNKKNIYFGYPESIVNMKWIDENKVEINGKILNINKDSFDWRFDKN